MPNVEVLMADAEWVSLLLQVPLVGVFIWFALETGKRQDGRDAQWQQFFERMVASQEAALDELSKHIDTMSEQLARNTLTLIMHDATVRGVNPETLGNPQDLLRKILDGGS